MASDSLSIQEVRAFLFQNICERLSPAEVRALVFTQDLPQSYCGKSAIEVLMKLEMLDRYSVSNLLLLSQILKKINRNDLAKKVEKYSKKQSRKKDSVEHVDARKHTDYVIEANLKVTKLQTLILLEQMEALTQSLRNGGFVRIEHTVAEAVQIIEERFQKKLIDISHLLATNGRLESSIESLPSVSPTNSMSSGSSSEDSLDIRSQKLEREHVIEKMPYPFPMHQCTSVSLQDTLAPSQACSQPSEDQYEELGLPPLPQRDDLIRAKPCPLPVSLSSFSAVDCTPQKNSQIEVGEIVTGRDNPIRAKPCPPPKPKPKNISKVQNRVDSDYSGGSCSGGMHADYSGGSCSGGMHADYSGGSSTSTGDSGFVESKRYLKKPLVPKKPMAISTYVPLKPEGRDEVDYYKSRTATADPEQEVHDIPSPENILTLKPRTYRKK